MSLFVLSCKDGWVSIMYDGLDAVGVDQQVNEMHAYLGSEVEVERDNGGHSAGALHLGATALFHVGLGRRRCSMSGEEKESISGEREGESGEGERGGG